MSTRTVYENAWIRVHEDEVLRPDGQPGIYGVVEVPPSVAVLAIDDLDRVVLVGQWRYTRAKYCWELPVGGAHPGETDLQITAARELREETGVEAASWHFLGIVEACVGVTTDTQSIYVARDLKKLPSAPDPEEVLQTRWIPFEDAVREVLQSEITECASMAAILKWNALRG